MLEYIAFVISSMFVLQVIGFIYKMNPDAFTMVNSTNNIEDDVESEDGDRSEVGGAHLTINVRMQIINNGESLEEADVTEWVNSALEEAGSAGLAGLGSLRVAEARVASEPRLADAQMVGDLEVTDLDPESPL